MTKKFREREEKNPYEKKKAPRFATKKLRPEHVTCVVVVAERGGKKYRGVRGTSGGGKTLSGEGEEGGREGGRCVLWLYESERGKKGQGGWWRGRKRK